MQNTKLLSGLRVVEMATFIAGPSCARILGDWGAEVIKVEPPRGDIYRFTGGLVQDDENPVFALENSNKRFIAIDMKKPEGVQAVYKLLSTADILITNYRREALEKLNLTYEALSKEFPELIYAHIQGYGDKGPLKDKPGFDTTAFFARGGLLAGLSQEGNGIPNIGPAVGDHTLGMYMVSGILAALYKRQETGKGELVKSGLYQAAIYTISSLLTLSQIGIEFPQNRNKPTSPINNSYPCKDGKWLLLAGVDWMVYYQRLFALVGLDDLINNEDYANPLAGLVYSEEITAKIEALMLTKDRKEWVEIFEEADFPHEIVMEITEILDDQQAWDNNYLTKFNYKTGNTGIFANAPVHFEGQSVPEFTHPARVGGQTKEIFTELGYTEAEIEALSDSGCILI
ncbi:CoA transferase [Fusibacter paucivorans]|uniref:CoA transferase n=1 Tax=Fusibacter paucivorans TaxID=76009 RepID=A0ABS5PV52_9FIRM|nr:CoA transferase [Fusibacter paucivorans]MBS7528349.1 CoA transferase [Fusibacter paucivorans]